MFQQLAARHRVPAAVRHDVSKVRERLLKRGVVVVLRAHARQALVELRRTKAPRDGAVHVLAASAGVDVPGLRELLRVGLAAQQIFGERDVCGREQDVGVGELFGGRRFGLAHRADRLDQLRERVGVDAQRVVAGVHDRAQQGIRARLVGTFGLHPQGSAVVRVVQTLRVQPPLGRDLGGASAVQSSLNRLANVVSRNAHDGARLRRHPASADLAGCRVALPSTRDAEHSGHGQNHSTHHTHL